MVRSNFASKARVLTLDRSGISRSEFETAFFAYEIGWSSLHLNRTCIKSLNLKLGRQRSAANLEGNTLGVEPALGYLISRCPQVYPPLSAVALHTKLTELQLL